MCQGEGKTSKKDKEGSNWALEGWSASQHYQEIVEDKVVPEESPGHQPRYPQDACVGEAEKDQEESEGDPSLSAVKLKIDWLRKLFIQILLYISTLVVYINFDITYTYIFISLDPIQLSYFLIITWISPLLKPEMAHGQGIQLFPTPPHPWLQKTHPPAEYPPVPTQVLYVPPSIRLFTRIP